jgi:hypothetical protein
MKGVLGRFSFVSHRKPVRHETLQRMPNPALPQDPLPGFRDGVEVRPRRAVARDGIKLFGVILEQREARPEESDDIDLVLGALCSPSCSGAPRPNTS